MNETLSLLKKIETVLIPFRQNSIGNRVPANLARELVEATDEPAVDDAYFYEFFADALYLKDPEGSDQSGIFDALAGLEEVLVSAVESANSPLEFKKQLLSALEKFKALIEARGAAVAENAAAAAPEKQFNIITYYLSDTRVDFFPPENLTKFFDESDETESRAIQKRDFKRLKKFFAEQKGLRYSEPVVSRIVEEIFSDDKERYSAVTTPVPENESQTDAKDGKHIPEITADEFELIKEAFNRLRERWRKTCLVGYRATRIAVETAAPGEKRFFERSQKTAWSVATLLKFAPSTAIERNDILLTFPSGVISDATRLCYDSYEYKTIESVEALRRIGRFVLQGEEYHWDFHKSKKRSSRRQRAKRNWVKSLLNPKAAANFGNKSGGEPLEQSLLPGDAWEDVAEREISEGAAPDEFDLADESATVENAPAGSAAESRAFRQIDEEASWGRTRLTDEMLGVAWALLKSQADQKPEDLRRLAVLTFTELLILFGFPPEFLLAAQIAENREEEQTETAAPNLTGSGKQNLHSSKANISSPVIIYENDSLRIRPVRTGKKSAFAESLIGGEEENYLPSNREFVVPLPSHINASLQKLISTRKNPSARQSNLVFSFFDDASGKTLFLDKDQINLILKVLGKSINEKITVEKIAKSARTLLREDGTLSDLEIALLSGEIPRRTASPMFYSNYKVLDLLGKYRQSVSRVLLNLITESKEFIEHFNPLDTTPLEPASRENYLIDLSKIDEGARVGSPFVPATKKFGNYLKNLRASVEKTNDLVLRHNRLTAFTALSLMTLTGLRPLELGFISHHGLNFSSSRPTLSVVAKINQKHSEWRTLDVSPEVVELLRKYQSLSLSTRADSNLLTEFTSAEIDARLEDNLFFYLRRSLAPVKLTTPGLNELVKDFSYLECPPYSWRLNSPRHFYRTTAVEIGVPEKVVNSLLGHQTAGSESLGLYSAYDRLKEAAFAREISDYILNKLDF